MSRRTLLVGAAATGLAAVGLRRRGGERVYAATATGLGPGGCHPPPGYPSLSPPAGGDRHPAPDRAHRGAHDGEPQLRRPPGHARPRRRADPRATTAARSTTTPTRPGASSARSTTPTPAARPTPASARTGTSPTPAGTTAPTRGSSAACGGASMGYWNADDLPYYHSMARKFPIGDRYFCSVMAQTYPNRRFLIAGTALGEHQHRRLRHLDGRRPQRHHLRPAQPVRHLVEGLLPRRSPPAPCSSRCS